MGGDTLQFPHDLATNGAKQVIGLFAGLGLALIGERIGLRMSPIQLFSYLG